MPTTWYAAESVVVPQGALFAMGDNRDQSLTTPINGVVYISKPLITGGTMHSLNDNQYTKFDIITHSSPR